MGGGKRPFASASLLHIAPTVLDLLGVKIPDGWESPLTAFRTYKE